MIIFQIILLILLFCYATALTLPAIRFPMAAPPPAGQDPLVDIIVCGRNESANIATCVRSILSQNYPRDRMIVTIIDDASDDSTAQIASEVLLSYTAGSRMIRNEARRGKKKSLDAAIRSSRADVIVTRDADTYTASPHWLRSMLPVSNSVHAMTIGPVEIAPSRGFLWALQSLESRMLMLLTGGYAAMGRPFLCSGANLAFTRKLFETLNGYARHIETESGDDVLFLEDARRLKDVSITYAAWPEATVFTRPVPGFSKLVAQRSRWSSKFRINGNLLNRLIAFLTLSANIGFIFSLAMLFTHAWFLAATFCVFKLAIDFLLLLLTPGVTPFSKLAWYSLPFGLSYPFYAVSVAFRAITRKPAW